MSQARRQEHLHDAPASWLLQNILNRNDKSEHITYSDDAIRIIINWTKAAKSIFRKIAPYLRPIQGHEKYHIAKNMPTFADVALILIMAL